ncbi:hypothetical protein IGI04_006737 [Brassica rapa subsp. trilocularis]|uniref:Uncharacterized protein n=1 Tax=Brassica rapa subsp. trilocularis TaxID=1813537 RepID=A0ABQ7NHR1_BRACM|nr:hypothetical protein IGI04_006737 [Brassica rapa subsp. trilocularis]
MGINQDGKQVRQDQITTRNPKLDENPNFGISEFIWSLLKYLEHQNRSGKIFGIDRGTKIHQKGQNRKDEVERPSTRCHDACNRSMLIDIFTSGRNGGVLYEAETCSQPCGARGVAVPAICACEPTRRGPCVAMHEHQTCSKPNRRGCVSLHVSEACRLTHCRWCGSSLLVDEFYKYPTRPFSFRHSLHTKATSKMWLEREIEKESGRF